MASNKSKKEVELGSYDYTTIIGVEKFGVVPKNCCQAPCSKPTTSGNKAGGCDAKCCDGGGSTAANYSVKDGLAAFRTKICEKDKEIEELKLELMAKAYETRTNKEKIDNLRSEWRSQQMHLAKLTDELHSLQVKLTQHSVYCATLGAIFGSGLWKLTRMEGAVENMLDGCRALELLDIIDGSLSAFLEVFADEIPDHSSTEYQFLLSCFGILTNVSASPDGRVYLILKSQGVKLLNKLIESIPLFRLPNGELLKRMALMVIYNVVINKTGLQLMQNNPNLITILKKGLSAPHSHDVIDLSVKLLHNLTVQITSKAFYKQILDEITTDFLERTGQTYPDKDTARMAKQIVGNLKEFEKELRLRQDEDAHLSKEDARAIVKAQEGLSDTCVCTVFPSPHQPSTCAAKNIRHKAKNN